MYVIHSRTHMSHIPGSDFPVLEDQGSRGNLWFVYSRITREEEALSLSNPLNLKEINGLIP